MLPWIIRSHPQAYETLKAKAKQLLPVKSHIGQRFVESASLLHQRYFEDYAFIHIPKCGGTSVERALGIPLLNHDTAIERRDKLGSVKWNSRFRFSVVRNPFHRMASLYFYWEKPANLDPEFLRQRYRSWIEDVEVRLSQPNSKKHLQTQLWWISDEQMTPIVDVVCRLESISTDIRKIGDRLGRDLCVPRIKTNCAAVNYSDIYCDASADVVKRLYADDFLQFGYETTPPHLAVSQ